MKRSHAVRSREREFEPSEPRYSELSDAGQKSGMLVCTESNSTPPTENQSQAGSLEQGCWPEPSRSVRQDGDMY